MAAGPTTSRFLLLNGVPVTASTEIPPVSSLLETISGAYTTTRTHNRATCLLFLDRHIRRLADSARILSESGHRRCAPPNLTAIERSVHHSLHVGLPLAVALESDDEIAVTALIGGGTDDTYLHLGFYSPPVFSAGGAQLSVAGRGREMAAAKYSDWARIRKGMEKMRPPSVTELLLSNDGDHILEGSVTNFFVIVRRAMNDSTYTFPDGAVEHFYEVQTAPLCDGVLPGIIRQVVIEACTCMGIPLREVAPSWSDRNLWEEAFITSSLRLVQYVETIQAPNSYEMLDTKTWKDVSWSVKRFEGGAGIITTNIQKEILLRAETHGYNLSNLI